MAQALTHVISCPRQRSRSQRPRSGSCPQIELRESWLKTKRKLPPMITVPARTHHRSRPRRSPCPRAAGHSRHWREIHRESGDRHRIADGSDRGQSGRSGFGPQLSLSYDSGTGNGPFGMGWSLSLPAITRKTDKGLPRYRDGEESDVFILSGAEDLVPVLRARRRRGDGSLDEFERDGYRVKRYRPRIEGLFARIERWTRIDDGDIHWRSLSKDNVLTVYGQDAGVAHRRSRRPRSRLQLADLPELRRQGQRDRLRLCGGKRSAALT